MTKPKRVIRAGSRPGPKPERLVVEGKWEFAVSRALAKGKPPTTPKKKKGRK